jgi:TPR repeat protein
VAAAREGLHTLKATAENYRTAAFQRTRERALSGEAAAQFDMGEYYYEGRGVTQDYLEAFQWFLKAAQKGHARAQLNAGLMLSIGRGVPKDDAEACRWLYCAAAQDNQAAKDLLDKAKGRMKAEDVEEGIRRARQSR